MKRTNRRPAPRLTAIDELDPVRAGARAQIIEMGSPLAAPDDESDARAVINDFG